MQSQQSKGGDSEADKSSQTNDGDKAETPKPRSRGRSVISKFDPEKDARRDFDSEEPITEEAKPDETENAFLLRKKLYSDTEDNSGELELNGTELLQIISNVLQARSYENWHLYNSPLMVESPYEPLLHSWTALREEANKEGSTPQDTRGRSDLKLLLDAITKGSGDPRLDQYFQTRDNLAKSDSITFNTLWTIFPPGTVVIGRLFQGQDQLFIVKDNTVVWPRFTKQSAAGKIKYWKLVCWTYDWNGTVFQRRLVTLEFDEFESSKPITSLPFHPVDKLDKERKIAVEKQLMKRGALFRKYCTADQDDRLFQYSGEATLQSGGGFHGGGGLKSHAVCEPHQLLR